MRPSPTRPERGHTIIEVMVAMVLFTVGVLGLLPLFVTSARGLTTSSKYTQATALAESKLAELMTNAYASLATGQEANNLDGSGDPAGTFGAATGSNGWFARSWQVTDTPVNGTGFKTMVVTVQWYDAAARRPRTVALAGGRGVPR